MRGNYEVIDEAISGACYYFMRLPRSLRSLAMTTWISYPSHYI
ncbi:RND transporter [Rickettsia parkeri]|nr:RND transporter [Rickettsia parkeri]